MGKETDRSSLVLIDTAKGPFQRLVTPIGEKKNEPTAEHFVQNIAQAIAEAAYKDTVLIPQQEMQQFVDVYRDGFPVVSLNPDLLPGDEPLLVNRLTLLNFAENKDIKTGMTGNRKTITKQVLYLGERFSGQKVVFVDDVSETGGTLVKMEQLLAEQNVTIAMDLVGVNMKKQNRLQNGTPIYSMYTGDEQTIGFELGDATIFGGGTPPQGYYENQQKLLKLYTKLEESLRDPHALLIGNKDTLMKQLTQIGVLISNPEAFMEQIQTISLDNLPADMIKLLTPQDKIDNQQPAALQIAGLNTLHADSRREPYIAPWRYRKGNPLGDLFTEKELQQLSIRTLDATREAITAVNPSLERNAIPSLMHPHVEVILAQEGHRDEKSATQTLAILGRKINADLDGPTQHATITVPTRATIYEHV